MERRTFLRGVGIGSAVLVAGCSGGSDDGGGGATTSVGGDDDGNLFGDGGDGGASSDGGGATTRPDTPTEVDSPTAGGDGEESVSTTTTGSDAGPRLGEVGLRIDPEYAWEMHVNSETMEDVTLVGRTSGGDLAVKFEYQGQTFEWYLIGQDTFVVAEGQCMRNPGGRLPVSDLNPDDQTDAERYEETAREFQQLTPTGTTTMDGERVYVYEVDAGEVSAQSFVMYVSATSGYPRRIEFDRGYVIYRSWGDVGQIQPPSC